MFDKTMVVKMTEINPQDFNSIKPFLPDYTTQLRPDSRQREFVTENLFTAVSPEVKAHLAGLAFIQQQDAESAYLLRCVFRDPTALKASLLTLEPNDAQTKLVTTGYQFSLVVECDAHVVARVGLTIRRGVAEPKMVWSTEEPKMVYWPRAAQAGGGVDQELSELNNTISFFICEKLGATPEEMVAVASAGGIYPYHQLRNTLIRGSTPRDVPAPRLRGPKDRPHLSGIWSGLSMKSDPPTAKEKKDSLRRATLLNQASSGAVRELTDEQFEALSKALDQEGLGLERGTEGYAVAQGSFIYRFDEASLKGLIHVMKARPGLEDIVSRFESETDRGGLSGEEVVLDAREVDALNRSLPAGPQGEELGRMVEGWQGELDEQLDRLAKEIPSSGEAEPKFVPDESTPPPQPGSRRRQIAVAGVVSIAALAIFLRHYGLQPHKVNSLL